jgi:hypothetical protein
MNGIDNKPFIECEQHLDIKTLEDLNKEIADLPKIEPLAEQRKAQVKY